MANNRELSQLGSFIEVDNNNGNIGIATTATPSVGIGTTNPGYKLDVYGDVNFEGSLYKQGQLFTSGVGIGSTSLNPYSGVLADADRIGIGFTDINFVGTGLSITGYGSTVVVDFGNIAAASGGKLSISTTTVSPPHNISFVGSAATNIIGIATPTDPFVFIPSTGRVGIGTSVPAEKLDVNGNINISGSYKIKDRSEDVLTDALIYSIVLG